MEKLSFKVGKGSGETGPGQLEERSWHHQAKVLSVREKLGLEK